MLYTEQQYENAFYALCRTRPRKFSKEFFKDYEKIIEYISFLRYSAFDEKFIVRILKVVQPLIDNSKRFKRNSIIKLLKGHMKKRPMKHELKAETSECLFRFY